MRSDIEAVVAYLRERYSDPISLADMAAVAGLSPFHFSRTFLAATGVTPGRFLSAVRLDRAKSLLLTTSETVNDISHLVGYHSVGTFTTRFTRSVGLAPVRYRRTSGVVSGIPGLENAACTMCPRSPVDSVGERGSGGWFGYPAAGSVDGHVSVLRTQRPNRIYVGLFDSAIAQGQLVAGAVLEGALAFTLPHVPEGEWYALAVGAASDVGAEPSQGSAAQAAWLVAREGPVKVVAGRELELRLTMRAPQPTDPPILLALPNPDSVGPLLI